MRLLPGITYSGIALAAALLLCAVINSQVLWVITWLFCLAWALTTVVTSLYIQFSRSYNQTVAEVRRNVTN